MTMARAVMMAGAGVLLAGCTTAVDEPEPPPSVISAVPAPEPNLEAEYSIPATLKGEICRASLQRGVWQSSCSSEVTDGVAYAVITQCVGDGSVTYDITVGGAFQASATVACGQIEKDTMPLETNGSSGEVKLKATASASTVTRAYVVIAPDGLS